jgi:hypothetical protein
LEEQRRERRPISVKAHGKSWLEHDQTTVNKVGQIRINNTAKCHLSVVVVERERERVEIKRKYDPDNVFLINKNITTD